MPYTRRQLLAGVVAVSTWPALPSPTFGDQLALDQSQLRDFPYRSITFTADTVLAIGYQALNQNPKGTKNVGIGYQALFSNTTGNYNIAVGYLALYANTTGVGNIAIGSQSLKSLTTQSNNIGLGVQTLRDTSTGYNNIAIGAYAGKLVTVGTDNTLLGYGAGNSITTGGWNTHLGSDADFNSATQRDYTVALGYAAYVDADHAVALGSQSTAGHADSVALGFAAATTATNQVTINDRHLEMYEISDPGNANANYGRLYMRDNGGGKTQLCVVFNTGAVQVLATEP